MGICTDLRAGAGEAWTALHEHPFVRGMADGTLRPESFRFYVEQNLMYLPEFGRVMGLGAAKADDLEQMAVFARACVEVVEVEIPTNRDLLARVSELAPAVSYPAVMAPGCQAYTSFLLQLGYQGGPAEIMAAVMPCAWSYGEIAAGLGEVAPHPVYAEWVAFFTGEEYHAVVGEMQEQFERMAAGADTARLQQIFTTAVRMEGGFWDMAYGRIQWPDIAVVTA